MAAGKVYIVGIGDDGVEGMTSHARRLVESADMLLGPKFSDGLLPSEVSSRFIEVAHLEEIVERIESAGTKQVVVLASGDPLFYGVARYVCSKLGKDRFEVVPHVSSMQLAFARVKESWEEAFLTNLSGQSIERILDRIRTSETIGLFTSEQWPPSAVGESLFGNPDDAFLQSRPKRGLLTPCEVRSLALAQMAIRRDSIIWDVGAGSGSVALEAARLARDGHSYAIEMDPDDHMLIRDNAERFGVGNLMAVLGRAPEAWADLPDPDAIFVGGSSRDCAMLVELAWKRLKPNGRLVTALASIENLTAVHALLRRQSGETHHWLVSIARGIEQLDRIRFESLNPVFLIASTKQDDKK